MSRSTRGQERAQVSLRGGIQLWGRRGTNKERQGHGQQVGGFLQKPGWCHQRAVVGGSSQGCPPLGDQLSPGQGQCQGHLVITEGKALETGGQDPRGGT